MYVPTYFQLKERDAVFELIKSNPLGTWVCCGNDGLIANHIPFYLDPHKGPFGTLMGHVARTNSVWQELTDTSSIVSFQGPQAYISPRWYSGKQEHGKVVPTWNYAVAHAHGVARVIDDRTWMRDMLNRLTNANEADQPTPWQVSDAPENYIEQLMRAIVGIEIPIDRLEGNLKASQNKSFQDQKNIAEGLQQQSRRTDNEMAALMQSSALKNTAE
ncbi:FMN-binding negative transcriptional regulator [Aestuariicella hydrocarbonica]|uniref:FMN-binding negative transcriptional regulator n=1 Tax=Pseudomaricurvus hydrocarbonicus TaxID=1470433 RepID=A0A9E5JXG4_9GAMM|nr:FMN-binding negative transcriptional regulator [Aestuariicella hydrocarbonica]NHO66730.1 FMN-binding negative transcriptional regulator [Aestuariicella hydrocarbonica]